ncbi:hypothetical protein SODG_002671 [Sodalis praecaptivus]
MSMVKIEDDLVYCGMMDSGEENSKAFRAEELTLYKEEGISAFADPSRSRRRRGFTPQAAARRPA